MCYFKTKNKAVCCDAYDLCDFAHIWLIQFGLAIFHQDKKQLAVNHMAMKPTQNSLELKNLLKVNVNWLKKQNWLWATGL